MPVTAKLSRKFYEKLGDEVADELVEWFNQVDATYSADLRELNELNFARFDARLEQRLASLDSRWESRFAALDAKWEGRFATIDTRFAEVRGDMRAAMASLETRLIRWMFGFWTLSMITLLGSLITVIRFVAPR